MFWNKKKKPLVGKVGTSEFDTDFKFVTFSRASASHSPHIIVNEYKRLLKDCNNELDHINKVNEIEVDGWSGHNIEINIKYPERLRLKKGCIKSDSYKMILDNDLLKRYVKTIDPENMTEVITLKAKILSLELELKKFKERYE